MKHSDISILDLLDFSPDRGLLGLDNRRVMIFDGNILMELRRMLVQAMGWKNCQPVIFQYGQLIGRLDAEKLGRVYGWQDKLEWFRAGPIMMTQRGLAKAVLTACEYDAEKDTLRFQGRWYNSYEVDSHKYLKLTEGETVCYVLCGYLSGFASVCFGREVFVVERSCFPGLTPCTFEGQFLPDWQDARVGEIVEKSRPYDLRSKYAYLSQELSKSHQEWNSPAEDILPFKEVVRECPDYLPCRSPGMSRVLEMVRRVAKTGAHVLLTGGTGVGKEVVANYIHAVSPRAGLKFLAINCTTLPEALLESELFGHVKGAFTGAMRDKKGLLIEAGDGTIFLDEIGEIPPSTQVKLLRALQERKIRPVGGSEELPIKARLITSTNRDLKEMMAKGTFRPDLYYRLSVFPIHIPDLKDRREDIIPIARYILSKTTAGSLGFSPQVTAALKTYNWPGNVRELENAIEYASILAGKDKIRMEHLPSSISQRMAESPGQARPPEWPSLQELEREYIFRVLEFCGGKKGRAAKMLGVGANTLWRKLKQ